MKMPNGKYRADFRDKKRVRHCKYFDTKRAADAWKAGQKAVYVTERAVFELTKDGLILTEVAPGVDVEKDILAQMEFKPVISPDLKKMRAGIFTPGWGELKEILEPGDKNPSNVLVLERRQGS